LAAGATHSWLYDQVALTGPRIVRARPPLHTSRPRWREHGSGSGWPLVRWWRRDPAHRLPPSRLARQQGALGAASSSSRCLAQSTRRRARAWHPSVHRTARRNGHPSSVGAAIEPRRSRHGRV